MPRLYRLPEVESFQTSSMRCAHCNFPATCVTNDTIAAAPSGPLAASDCSWAEAEQCSLSPYPSICPVGRLGGGDTDPVKRKPQMMLITYCWKAAQRMKSVACMKPDAIIMPLQWGNGRNSAVPVMLLAQVFLFLSVQAMRFKSSEEILHYIIWKGNLM